VTDVVGGVGEGVCVLVMAGEGGRRVKLETTGERGSGRGEGGGDGLSETAVVGVGRRVRWCERMSGTG
jgi:hypothetical protein